MLNGLPWKQTQIILWLLRLHPRMAFQILLLIMRTAPFLLRDSCPQYLIQWSSGLNSSIPVHFSSWIPKMSVFTLAISCLTMSNLPWFMDLIFQVPMHYCSLQHQILLSSPDTSTTEHHIHFGAKPLHSFWDIFSRCPLLFPSSILDTFWPGGLIL